MEIKNIYFSPGYHGVTIAQPTNIERSSKRRELSLWCNGKHMGDNILRDLFVELESLDDKANKILYKLFKIEEKMDNATCYFGGDGWVMDSNNYKVDIVKFTMPTSNMPNK